MMKHTFTRIHLLFTSLLLPLALLAQSDSVRTEPTSRENLQAADEIMKNPRSPLVKKINIAVDTGLKTVVLPVKPGTNLASLNPGFPSQPAVSVLPSGAQNFTQGLIDYKVSPKGGVPQTYRVTAKEYHNPVIEGYYADPEILYAEKTKKFYLYPTSDGFKEWSGTYFKAFSSADLVNWKDEGVILSLSTDVKWAKIKAWAPCIAEKKTKGHYNYYYYFVAEKKIGVATASDPLGPFVDNGKPLIEERPEGLTRGAQIDPDVFTDPKTGKTYLYWGNYYLAGAELADDMTSLKAATTRILTPDSTYREGTYVFYRRGKYYFMWSENDTRDPDYRIRYGIADSPLGQIKIPVNNLVLEKNKKAGIYATGHNSVMQIPGRDEWYIVYHRFTYPNGIAMGRTAGYYREICIEKLEFANDGRIKQVTPTHTGIKPINRHR